MKLHCIYKYFVEVLDLESIGLDTILAILLLFVTYVHYIGLCDTPKERILSALQYWCNIHI